MTDTYKLTDKNLDFKKLKFNQSRQTSGNRFIKVFYNKQALEFSLPTLTIPFTPKIDQYNKLSINVSLGEKHKLINKLQELDSEIQDFALMEEWYDPESIENVKYFTSLKKSSGGNYPPFFTCKVVKKRTGELDLEVVNSEGAPLQVSDEDSLIDLLGKGTQIRMAVECTCVWLRDDSYGLAWKVKQIRIIKEVEQEFDPNFIDDLDETKNDSDIEYLFG